MKGFTQGKRGVTLETIHALLFSLWASSLLSRVSTLMHAAAGGFLLDLRVKAITLPLWLQRLDLFIIRWKWFAFGGSTTPPHPFPLLSNCNWHETTVTHDIQGLTDSANHKSRMMSHLVRISHRSNVYRFAFICRFWLSPICGSHFFLKRWNSETALIMRKNIAAWLKPCSLSQWQRKVPHYSSHRSFHGYE